MALEKARGEVSESSWGVREENEELLVSVLGLGSGGPYYYCPESVGRKSVTFLQ